MCAALAMLGCGGDSMPATNSSDSVTATRTAVPQPATTRPTIAGRQQPVPPVRVRSSRYGRILVDRQGRTLYLFTADSANVSRCNGDCAHAWPPYLARRTLGRRQGAGQGLVRLVGQVRREDGSRQVTVGGHPLYYYVGDRRPGQILCQDVEEYGGHWWLISPAGRPVTGSAPPC